MAELILKVGDQGREDHFYKDGDIICAFNDRHIQQIHAEHICHIKLCPFNKDGLNTVGSLADKIRRTCQQYRFERVSATEVRRINQWTLDEELFSNTPNARGEAIVVDEYIRRRLEYPRHLIFGETGKEIWFGGKKDFSQARINLVWNDIETDTPLRKSDHTLFPLGTDDKKVHLAVKLKNDFDEVVSKELVESEVGLIDDVSVMVKKRRKYIEIESLPLSEMKTSLDDIANIEKEVDTRSERELTIGNRVLTKPLVKKKSL